MEERQRQERTSQRAGQEKEVKGKAKNGRELESNTHTISHTLGWRGAIICTKKPHGKRRETNNISRDWREKQNAKDIKKGREERNTVTQSDRNRRERRPFECD